MAEQPSMTTLLTLADLDLHWLTDGELVSVGNKQYLLTAIELTGREVLPDGPVSRIQIALNAPRRSQLDTKPIADAPTLWQLIEQGLAARHLELDWPDPTAADPTESSASTESSEPPAKRGRGRPRKTS